MLKKPDLEKLSDKISLYNRSRFGHFPTPLEPLNRLRKWLNGPNIYVKRDDTSGLGQGGNKIRALEYLIPDALAVGADILITAGVVQSNSVRQVAAAAAKFGLDCHFAMITDRVENIDEDYGETGNIFLDHLYGATHELMSVKDDKTVVLEQIAARLESQGRRPYIVPFGCANLLGSIGYLNAALEIARQISEQNLEITHLVHASGTGGTQAGLIAGFGVLGLPIEVIGIDIDADPAGVRNRVSKCLREIASALGMKPGPLEDKIIINSNYSAGAYGQANAPTVEAITRLAQLEALNVDPVYTGKSLAGLIDLCRTGYFKDTDKVVFLHTGGVPAIYAYRSIFSFKQ